jgi:hypothetical protein
MGAGKYYYGVVPLDLFLVVGKLLIELWEVDKELRAECTPE